MINSRYSARANLISHNYLCASDRHRGWAGDTEVVDADWVICPALFQAEGWWELCSVEPLCRCVYTAFTESKKNLLQKHHDSYSQSKERSFKCGLTPVMCGSSQ